jgi:uncharacterized protein
MSRANFLALIITVAYAFPQIAVAKVPPKKVSPSFDCSKVHKASIDAIICADRELSKLDRTMGQDYKRAGIVTPSNEQSRLLREQRDFIANRNLCMKRKADRQPCIAFAYESRIMRLEEWNDGSAW